MFKKLCLVWVLTPVHLLLASGMSEADAAPAQLPGVRSVRIDPNGAARMVAGERLKAIPHENDAPPELNGEPERLRFLFDGEKQKAEWMDCRQRQIIIYPLKDYAALFNARDRKIFGELVADLKKTLAARPKAPRAEIPIMPRPEAFEVFKSQVKYLKFGNGQGIRCITRYAQDITPTKNEDLFYSFQGQTADGKYWVAAYWPVAARGLPVTDKVEKTSAFLGRLKPSDFTPDLTKIDGVIQSLRF